MSGFRVLLLAAGSSQRLRPLTDEIPKTLLRLNGKTILNHIIGCCVSSGLHQVTLVTGHGEERVREECEQIRSSHPQCDFSYIHCPEYGSMGNVYSLYVAKPLFGEPLILINSDLVFAQGVLSNLLSDPHESALVVDDQKQLGIEEMKVLAENGVITSINKSLEPGTAQGEYIGMSKLSPGIGPALESALHRLVQSAPEKYYEDAFQLLMNDGICFSMVSTGGAPCMEIDTFDDLAVARENAHLWV